MKDTEFVQRWAASTGSERQIAQTHFRDLCELLGEPYPHQVPGNESTYCYEKGIEKSGGGDGFADVWLDQRFGWEYKGKHKDLQRAYKQLVDYHENLNSPPLLVVCDIDRYEVHTRWTNLESWTWKFRNEDITKGDPVEVTGSGGAAIQNAPKLSAIEVLRACWQDPGRLKPNATTEQITKQAAELFDGIAETLRKYKVEDMRVARFISRVVFCMFATDVGLLPPETFSALLKNHAADATKFRVRLGELFREMRDGGDFGSYPVRHFNGELFADDDVPEWVTAQEILALGKLNALNWADVEPAIFGTLFERVLDKAEQRAKLGAHYTSREDIELLVEPVLMWPFRRQWEAIKEQTESLRARTDSGRTREVEKLVAPLLDELASVRVLDPACGSGNFLYVSLALLKALEKEVLAFAGMFGVHLPPRVHPRQLYGIEINPYAHELASIVIWIGYLQWKHRNALPLDDDDPILRRLDQIELKDAILSVNTAGVPRNPEWPSAEIIVGNPPFLGDKKMRRKLGNDYVDSLRTLFSGAVPGGANLCSYWFERAREHLLLEKSARVGLLATNSIRDGANAKVLERIAGTADIFFAESNRPWVLDGVAVRVAMVAFARDQDPAHQLDGLRVRGINHNLTAGVDLTVKHRLLENRSLGFIGVQSSGPFQISQGQALWMLSRPNPDGRPNSEVVRPWLNGDDITDRPTRRWIIDIPNSTAIEDAAKWEAPFEHLRSVAQTARIEEEHSFEPQGPWWSLHRSRPALKKAITPLERFICTPRVSKYRVFIWANHETLPDTRLVAFARQDDYFFGILESSIHREWSLATSPRHGVGNDPTYNNTTCFETFPFPWPPGKEPVDDPKVQAIAAAAKQLNEWREGWLNPQPVDGLEIPEAELKKRTLTNLYNERPAWLDNAHRALDAAVFAAYGWPATLTDEEILERLLALNLERAAAQ